MEVQEGISEDPDLGPLPARHPPEPGAQGGGPGARGSLGQESTDRDWEEGEGAWAGLDLPTSSQE